MTEREHEVWMKVCDASKLGRWFEPTTHGDRIVAANLHRARYMQRRSPLRLGKAYRLLGFWPQGAP